MFNRPTQQQTDAMLALAGTVETDWALLTAGEQGDWNTMTIGWGSVGTLWKTPTVTVYVHPRRYTHEFMLRSDYFTVALFGSDHKRDLGILGSKSGRDGDKVALTSLTPKALEHGVTFEEASSTLVCRKIYTHAMELDACPQEVLDNLAGLYESQAHTLFIGEVVAVV